MSTLNPQQFDRWQTGECGTYASALIQARPNLKLGVAGNNETGGGWYPNHFFAHDETHAYDSAGTHKLPYTGLSGQFDHVELGHSPEHWGLPDDEENDDPEQQISDARAHAKKLGQI